MHKLTYQVTNYAGAPFARKIAYACSCGIRGALHDGRSAPTRKRAKAAHDRRAA